MKGWVKRWEGSQDKGSGKRSKGGITEQNMGSYRVKDGGAGQRQWSKVKRKRNGQEVKDGVTEER